MSAPHSSRPSTASTACDDAALRRDVAATLMPGFVGTELPDWLAGRLRSGLGGVCIFGANIVSHEQLRSLTEAIRAANPHAVIAVDEEGGDVTRLYYASGSPYPGAAVLGRIGDIALTEDIGRAVGRELALAGVTLNFAPDADVNSNPDNPVIGVRSFGSDPEDVARHVAAWVSGHQATGVAVAAKHFPGHGDTALDSHAGLPVVHASRRQLQERELVPFRAAITAGARAIMTSHVLLPAIDPEFPATHSSRVLHDILRRELGFDGVVVSDALDMKGASGVHGIPEAAVRSLVAGCDLLCLGAENTDGEMRAIEEAVLAAVISGRLSVDRIGEAAARVRTLGSSSQVAATRPRAGRESTLTLDRIIDSFDISRRGRAWLEAREPIGSIVRIDAAANIAVGDVPWGPFAQLAAVPAAPESPWSSPIRLSAESAHDGLDAAGAVAVIGRDIHRHSFARKAIDRWRARGRGILVIDMGWPSDDRAYADIATFGASRLIGAALIDFLDGEGTA